MVFVFIFVVTNLKNTIMRIMTLDELKLEEKELREEIAGINIKLKDNRFAKSLVMKTKTKEVYYCEHCKKHFISKHFAQRHEERCSKNPDNFRACFGCKYLKLKTAKVYVGIDEYYSCEPIYEDKEILFCEKLNHFVYPPKAEHKGTYYQEFDDDKNENKPMPEECEFVDYNIS